MLPPSTTPLVPMVGPSRRTTGPVVESSRPSIAFARVAETSPARRPFTRFRGRCCRNSRASRKLYLDFRFNSCVFTRTSRASKKLYLDSSNVLSILRRKNCKLCFFCRYHVEKTCVPRTICLYFVESLSKSRKSRIHVVIRL